MYKIEVAMKVPGDFTACQIKFWTTGNN
jgi:hypothetical protein